MGFVGFAKNVVTLGSQGNGRFAIFGPRRKGPLPFSAIGRNGHGRVRELLNLTASSRILMG